MTTHPCPGGCGAAVPSDLLACKACWYRLPQPYRDETWAAWRVRREDPRRHRNAVTAAITWYRDQDRIQRGFVPIGSEQEMNHSGEQDSA